MRRISATSPLAALLLVFTGALTACSGDDDERLAGAETAAGALADALTAAAAPEPSADPFAGVGVVPAEEGEPVADDYAAVIADMDGIAPTVAVEEVSLDEGAEDAATARLAWSWPVVADVAPWSYTTEVALRLSGETWTAQWARSVVEPSLAPTDALDAVTLPTQRGDVTGANGVVLVTERPVTRLGIDRTRVPAAKAPTSARSLARLVGIDVGPYVAAVRSAGPRAFVEAITYRADDVPDAVVAGLPEIDGALQYDDTLALAPTREFAAPILGRVGQVTAEMVAEEPDTYRVGDVAGVSGLQARYDDQLRGRVGRAVEVVSSDDETGTRRVYEQAAVAGEPLALTLDAGLQSEAERLLADVGPASAVVALRPSDGAVLVAANGPGTAGRNDATFGRYAPGSTFKIVSSLALLRSGLSPEATLECPGSITVNGKAFGNYSDYPASSLGRIPLGEAVAQSCNTAFIGARSRLDDGDLAAAAASLGLGIDHDLGFPAYFGDVPDPASETEAAADLIGQGRIQASPMVMATVIASVQAGRTVVPRLVEQVDVAVPDAAAPLTDAEARQLRTLLRRVVTEGSGRGLADVPGPPVLAKTGTAEYADGDTIRTHAWMVAAQGDLAVAVFVATGESGSRTAGPILEAFLRAAR